MTVVGPAGISELACGNRLGVGRHARALLVALTAALPSVASAQDFAPVARDGWEAFRKVEYLGGDLGLSLRKTGVVVLRDSTLSFHECVHPKCYDDPRGEPFKEKALLTINLRQVVAVGDKAQVRAASGTSKLILGANAADHDEETVTVSYETDRAAEAPVFKTQKAQSAALVAKINFRRKKLGLKVDSLSL